MVKGVIQESQASVQTEAESEEVRKAKKAEKKQRQKAARSVATAAAAAATAAEVGAVTGAADAARAAASAPATAVAPLSASGKASPGDGSSGAVPVAVSPETAAPAPSVLAAADAGAAGAIVAIRSPPFKADSGLSVVEGVFVAGGVQLQHQDPASSEPGSSAVAWLLPSANQADSQGLGAVFRVAETEEGLLPSSEALLSVSAGVGKFIVGFSSNLCNNLSVR